MYNNLLTFGDIIELDLSCDTSQLINNISKYEWLKYNPRKDINRYGLSVTSLDGKLTGIDLDSISIVSGDSLNDGGITLDL